MSLLIASGLDDDTDVTTMLHSIVRKLVARESPEQVWVIRIENWFSDKWLRFSGKDVVDSPFPASMNRYDGALNALYQDGPTFPPFTPKRVVGQWSYVRSPGGYVEAPVPWLLHALARRPSQANLQRRARTFNNSACFFWYSGKTLLNGRGSLMVYIIGPQTSECWLAGFVRAAEWSITTRKAVSRSEVRELARGALGDCGW